MIDTCFFLDESFSNPRSIREMPIIFPCHWRAKNVQPRIFHRGHSMLEASAVLEEISTMGRLSHLSLSLSLPFSISELITRTLVNRVRSRWPQKCSRTHDLRRSELGSRFVVHCGGEREGEIAAQRVNAASAISLSLSLPLSLSLSPFVFVVTAVRRISMWVNSVLDYARARMHAHDFQNEVSGGAHRARRDTVPVLLANEVEVVKGGRGQLSTDKLVDDESFGIWDENRIRKKYG